MSVLEPLAYCARKNDPIPTIQSRIRAWTLSATGDTTRAFRGEKKRKCGDEVAVYVKNARHA
ncbi:hypothetical protein BDV93DRAFT_556119 [Ceratobasidium sp. AG-I]|nr:hypothetical protein BDV93DRAFT_556119 [Ceratobasidium sp. AG-I]